MKNTIAKKAEIVTCGPTNHNFISLDITPNSFHGNYLGGQMGSVSVARQYIVFCTKCAATKRIV